MTRLTLPAGSVSMCGAALSPPARSPELHQLFSMLLIETEPDTPDRRNILATLENIERAMGCAARPSCRC